MYGFPVPEFESFGPGDHRTRFSVTQKQPTTTVQRSGPKDKMAETYSNLVHGEQIQRISRHMVALRRIPR